MADDRADTAPQAPRCIHTRAAPPPFGDAYCQAVVAGGFVFVSGQGGFRTNGDLVGGGARAQAAQTIANLRAILQAAGAGLEDVVRTTIYYADLRDSSAVNEVYKEAFPGPVRPARMVFQVALTPVPGALVWMDAQAVLPNG